MKDFLIKGLDHSGGHFFSGYFSGYFSGINFQLNIYETPVILFYYLPYTLNNASKFFCPKKYKTRRVKPLRASLWFSRMVGWCTWFRENQSSDTKIKSMLIIYIVLTFGWRSILFFSFVATRKKFLNFLLQFLGPNYMLLLLIIIKQNIILTKSSVTRKTLVLRISVLNFKSIR